MNFLSNVDWTTLSQQVSSAAMTVVVPLAVAALGLAIVTVLPKVPGLTQSLSDLVKHRADVAESGAKKAIIDRLIDIVTQKVIKLEQVEIAYLVQQKADGKITTEQLPALLGGVKDKAVAMILEEAKAQNLWDDATQIFGGNSDALKKWVMDEIEKVVFSQKPSGLDSPKVGPPPADPSPAQSAVPAVGKEVPKPA